MPKKTSSTAAAAAVNPAAQAKSSAPTTSQSKAAGGGGGATSSSKESEEWQAKNARAKAIIMSTLVPGSEPWKIAEPLELASDIWKALEDRYAPPKNKRDTDNSSSSSSSAAPATSSSSNEFIAKWVDNGEPLTLEKKDPLLQKAEQKAAVVVAEKKTTDFRCNLFPRPEDYDTEKEYGVAVQERNALLIRAANTIDQEKENEKRKEAQAAAKSILAENFPNRDQRFLWALLHGGKAETMAWFNGTSVG